MEYFQAVKIRDNAISEGKELKRNCLVRKRERKLLRRRPHAKTRDRRRCRGGDPRNIDRMGRSTNIRQLCPDAAGNTNPDQRHAETDRRKNRTPPHLPRPWKRCKSRTAQRDKIRRITRQRRSVSLRKKSMPIPRRNTPHQTRKDADQRTVTKEIDRSDRKIWNAIRKQHRGMPRLSRKRSTIHKLHGRHDGRQCSTEPKIKHPHSNCERPTCAARKQLPWKTIASDDRYKVPLQEQQIIRTIKRYTKK